MGVFTQLSEAARRERFASGNPDLDGSHSVDNLDIVLAIKYNQELGIMSEAELQAFTTYMTNIGTEQTSWNLGDTFAWETPSDDGGDDGSNDSGDDGSNDSGGGESINLDATDITQVSGFQSIATSQQDIGISSGAVGSRKELGRMLETYLARRPLIQTSQRQKAIYTIDRFDGGLNLNKSPRDLAYWEACQLDCLTPSKIGRLIMLGDFSAKISASGGDGLESLVADDVACVENYGLHYFKLSNEKDLGATGTPTNYIAMQDGNDINIWDLSDDTTTANVITGLQDTSEPVYHSISNRVYVSDASFNTSVANTYMFGIVDRRKLFPYTAGSTVSYGKTGNSVLFTNQSLYHAAPIKGKGAGEINVVGTQTASTAITAVSNAEDQHHGIYMNINFEDLSGDEIAGIGWGGSTGAKYYIIYASWLYDDGSESKLTPVSEAATAGGADDENVHTIKATTTAAGVYQKMVIKQVYIDGTEMFTNFPRVHGVRFYYTEADGADGNPVGNDKYLFAELDFRYGFKLVSEFNNWNLFEDDSSALAAVQVSNASSTDGNADAGDGTLQILSPPSAFTYYALNLFHQEELKNDLLWKTSTTGNGIAFVGNIKYDGREYPDTMLYSGAGETDAGSAYPMWGTFPVDSNRIDIPGAAGEITALKWTSNKVLQFRQNALYVVNVEDVLSPRVEGVYQGMGVHGQYAVTETSFGVAWVNDTGCYAYNTETQKARSLTIGRLDTEDWQANSPHANTKIGYDDRAKMLIITNTTKYDTDGYHYAYSFVTDAWCSWNANKSHASNVKTNLAIDHEGYLTGAVDSSTTLNVYKWSAAAQATATIDYVTKDIDFGKPNLDKRFYTLYISYTGGTSQSIGIYFRVNGREGKNLTDNWIQLGTVDDFTDPYGDDSGSVWATSGDPTTGDPYIPTAGDGLDSADTGEQKLAKINLRSLSGSFPADYLKFARSIQLRFTGTAATTLEINDISLIYKEKRLK
jgi:hypothetical protein